MTKHLNLLTSCFILFFFLYSNNLAFNAPEDSVVTINVPGYSFGTGTIDWIDYDNDRDLDLLVSGTHPDSGKKLMLLRNDYGNYSQPVFSVRAQQSGWVDYNGDNRLDLYSAESYGTLYIYLNEGNGNFKMKFVSLGFFEPYACSWIDYDKDGDPDFIFNGRDDGSSRLCIFRNDGNDLLVRAEYFPLASNFSWGDFNRDGYPDLVMQASNENGIRLYRNLKTGYFHLTQPQLTTQYASPMWYDYNSDGYEDLLISTRNAQYQIFTKVFVNNNGNGTFTDVNVTLPGVFLHRTKFADYDNDGDADIFAGAGDDPNFWQSVNLFLNDHKNNIITKASLNYPQASLPKVDLADYDKDGDLDAIIHSGKISENTSSYIKIIKNQLLTPNSAPSVPVNLNAAAAGDSVIFSWNKSTDKETNSEAITYNLRIGTSPGASDIFSPLALQDGTRLIHSAGNTSFNNSITIKGLLKGTYYWSVQAIDQGFAVSQFSQEKSFINSGSSEQKFADVNAGLPGLRGSDAEWGDYDADGDLDFIISGWSGAAFPVHLESSVYRNDNGTFTKINARLIPLRDCAIAWGDYNNDGLLDLAMAGMDSISTRRTYVYKNSGNNNFQKINTAFTGVHYASLCWGDYDNDGDLDLLVSGVNSSYDDHNSTRLYRNNGDDTFSNIELNMKITGKLSWADFDNDSDLDFSLKDKVYRNEDNNKFSDIGVTFIDQDPNQKNGPLVWGDYDSDGDVDLLSATMIYRNDNGSFIKTDTLLRGMHFLPKVSIFADLDNDGDADILTQGYVEYSYKPAIFYLKNNGTGKFIKSDINIPAAPGGMDLGDYDNDGDLDILITGETVSGDVTKIYRNDGLHSNKQPEAPANLSAELSTGTVYLRWTGGTDTETSKEGLSYNLSIGRSPGSANVKHPMSDLNSGHKYISGSGNINQVKEWQFKPKQSGTFYFSVQSIDNNFAGSHFSEPGQFIIPNTPPTPVTLYSPGDSDTLDNYDITFQWSKSLDHFSDTLAYSLKIYSTMNDTTISSLADTLYKFNGIGWIIPGVKYNWTVTANDDKNVTASAQTFSFVKRKLFTGVITDSMFVYITNQKDSVSFTDKQGRMLMQIFWEPGAVQGANDTLRIGLVSNQLTPPSNGAKNINLTYPLLIEPKNLNSVKLYPWYISIRLYADTTIYPLYKLKDHNAVYSIDEHLSIFSKLSYSSTDYKKNHITFNPSEFKKGNLFVITAENILRGTISEREYKTELTKDILIPKGETVVMNEGVKLNCPGLYTTLRINGNLLCNGTKEKPVDLGNLNIEAQEISDTIFSNNQNMLTLKNVTAGRILINSTNALIEDSRVKNTVGYAHSVLRMQRAFISGGVGGQYSKIYVDSSYFDSSGSCGAYYSVLDIRNSVFKYFDDENRPSYSFVYLKNNIIYADAFLAPLSPLRCFLLFEGNKFIFPKKESENGNKHGTAVYSDNYAIIRYNLFAGFQNGVDIDYGNKSVIYNNTFVNNGTGVDVSGTPNTSTIVNNIFYNQNTAINLDFSTYTGKGNTAYINNNLWKERNPNWAMPYIDNRTEHSVVIGDSIAYHTDPMFANMSTYKLDAQSPAIDKGVDRIPAYKFSFSVLDTTVTMDSILTITEFYGKAPDLGAYEFDGTTDIITHTMPMTFQLHQNYPNPFNPATTIEFTIPEFSKVELNIFNILGEKMLTLKSGEFASGRYKVTWSAGDFPSGIYFLTMKAGEFTQTRKLVLLK